MVSLALDAGWLVPVWPTLVPSGVVAGESPGPVALPVHIAPSIHWGLEQRRDNMRRGPLPYPRRLAMDRLVHGPLSVRCMPPCKPLPHTPECAKFRQPQRHRLLDAPIGVCDA